MARLLVSPDSAKQPGTSQFRLTEWIQTAPFEDLLNMSIEQAADGEAILSLPFRVKHANGGGVMHGGVLVALADTAVAMAIKSVLPQGTRFATTQLQTRFHAPAHAGRVTARAFVSGPDGRTFTGRAEILSEDARLLADFDCIFRVARGQGFVDTGEQTAD